jgi:ABC-2 type transport system permease protein
MLFRTLSMWARYPIDIFPLLLKRIFTFIIPIGYLGAYPTMILMNKDEKFFYHLLIIFFALIFWMVLLVILWKKAIKHYDSLGG